MGTQRQAIRESSQSSEDEAPYATAASETSSSAQSSSQPALGSAAAAATPSLEKTKRVSLRRNFAWTLAGDVIYAACQWGMLVSIAKLRTPAMLGQFALGLAVAPPVVILTRLQLRALLATDAGNDSR